MPREGGGIPSAQKSLYCTDKHETLRGDRRFQNGSSRWIPGRPSSSTSDRSVSVSFITVQRARNHFGIGGHPEDSHASRHRLFVRPKAIRNRIACSQSNVSCVSSPASRCNRRVKTPHDPSPEHAPRDKARVCASIPHLEGEAHRSYSKVDRPHIVPSTPGLTLLRPSYLRNDRPNTTDEK